MDNLRPGVCREANVTNWQQLLFRCEDVKTCEDNFFSDANVLEINSLALNNCFSYINVFQNGVNAFSKNGFKKHVFYQKA